MKYRRIVTDLDDKITSDKIIEPIIQYEDGHSLTEIWVSEKATPDLSDDYVPNKFTLDLPLGGSRFVSCTIPPFSKIRNYELNTYGSFSEDLHGIHSTQTLDYVIVLEGQVDLVTKNGRQTLKKGDVVVQRGAKHAWHNISNSNCEIIAVMIGAQENSKFQKQEFKQIAKELNL